MKDVYEVRMHARAGQGAKTGSQLLAEAAFKEGKWIQAFPEYGSERRGAPTVSYTRISNSILRTHEPILYPDAVLVFDDGITKSVPVASGLSDNGILIINTTASKEEMKKLIGFNGKIFTVDATGIALNTIGIDASNVPMIGALTRVSNIVKIESLEEVIKEHFLLRLGEEKVKKNLDGLRMAYEEVMK
jgi:pyruvate ferredoxin oxidoreductase gamma subunit